jgi:hypothetical protein
MITGSLQSNQSCLGYLQLHGGGKSARILLSIGSICTLNDYETKWTVNAMEAL